jgi:hypothetical protein
MEIPESWNCAECRRLHREIETVGRWLRAFDEQLKQAEGTAVVWLAAFALLLAVIGIYGIVQRPNAALHPNDGTFRAQ